MRPIRAYKRIFRNMDVGLGLRFVQSYVYISRFQRGIPSLCFVYLEGEELGSWQIFCNFAAEESL